MRELSRITLGEEPVLSNEISKLRELVRLGKVKFKVHFNLLGISIKTEPKNITLSNFRNNKMLCSRDKILECTNEFLENRDFYLAETSFYPEKFYGIIATSIEGVLYKLDTIDD